MKLSRARPLNASAVGNVTRELDVLSQKKTTLANTLALKAHDKMAKAATAFGVTVPPASLSTASNANLKNYMNKLAVEARVDTAAEYIERKRRLTPLARIWVMRNPPNIPCIEYRTGHTGIEHKAFCEVVQELRQTTGGSKTRSKNRKSRKSRKTRKSRK